MSKENSLIKIYKYNLTETFRTGFDIDDVFYLACNSDNNHRVVAVAFQEPISFFNLT